MLTTQQARRVAIIGYNRIPFARQNTAYTMASNQDMMTAALNGLIDRYKLSGMLLGEVAGGAVIKSSLDLNLIRECVLSTSLNPATPACDIQQACDTGMEAAVYIANKIALGQIEVGIAGGVDSTSNVPILMSASLTKKLLAVRRAKTTGARLKTILSIRPSDFAPNPPENVEPRTGLSMGGHTEFTTKYYKIPRQEQDQFAYESHKKLAQAYAEGFWTICLHHSMV